MLTVSSGAIRTAEASVRVFRFNTAKTIRLTAKNPTITVSPATAFSAIPRGNKEITAESDLTIPVKGHKESKWKSNIDTNWKECTVKGCGAVIDGTLAEHEFSEKGKFEICGFKRSGGTGKSVPAAEEETKKPEKSSETPDDTPETPAESDTTENQKHRQ